MRLKQRFLTDTILNNLKETVIEAIQTAEHRYHRLIILAGTTDLVRTELIESLADHFGKIPINAGLELSKALLELTPRQRVLNVSDLLRIITEKSESPVFLDNTEILFDIHLKLDPLRLLESLSRNKTIVATWNGIFKDGKLIFAEHGHPEFGKYDNVDAVVISID